MIKIIIFDWGGVCTYGHLLKSFCKKLALELNRDENEIEQEFRKIDYPYETGKISPDQFWQSFKEALDTDMAEDKMKELFLNNYELNNDVLNLVKLLREKYQIILLTNNYEDLFGHIKNLYNLSEYFDFMYSSSEIRSKKPEPDIYHYLLKKHDLKPQECVFIDDKEKNVTAAKELGFYGIIFNNILQLKKDLLSINIKI